MLTASDKSLPPGGRGFALSAVGATNLSLSMTFAVVVGTSRAGLEMTNHTDGDLIGASLALTALRAAIAQVARSDSRVLITGESGVGKELVARVIHERSARAERPFLAVNCTGMPEALLESELFGCMHENGNGGPHHVTGTLELAERGTVFLNEVGELTPRMQGLLLRFLETGELQRCGNRPDAPADVRVIAATNRNLAALAGQSQFREDLYYRLKVIHLHVPPLRERKADIPALAGYFLGRLASTNRYAARTFSPDALAAMSEYRWPGNVRELENVIERLAVTVQAELVTAAHLPEEIRGARVAGANGHPPTVVDELYDRLVGGHESFWTAVYPLYMQREITRATVRDLVRKGLEEARGNYRIVTRLFNVEPKDYKKFLNFLRKHACQLPYKEYRCSAQERA